MNICVERINWSRTAWSYFDRTTTVVYVAAFDVVAIAIVIIIALVCMYICEYICFSPLFLTAIIFVIHSHTFTLIQPILYILLHFNFCHWITQIEQFISYLSVWCTMFHFQFNSRSYHTSVQMTDLETQYEMRNYSMIRIICCYCVCSCLWCQRFSVLFYIQTFYHIHILGTLQFIVLKWLLWRKKIHMTLMMHCILLAIKNNECTTPSRSYQLCSFYVCSQCIRSIWFIFFVWCGFFRFFDFCLFSPYLGEICAYQIYFYFICQLWI